MRQFEVVVVGALVAWMAGERGNAAGGVLQDEQLDEYVVATFEDRQGNLWFGTLSSGAARFDGTKLTYFTTQDGLVENRVVDFAQDQAGNLWIAHGDRPGATRFDGTSFVQVGQHEGLIGSVLTVATDRRGRLWAGTTHGAFVYDGKSFQDFKLPKSTADQPSFKIRLDSVWCIREDSHGAMWFGTDGNGVFRHDGQSFAHFTTRDGLCTNNVIDIREDRRGNLWFGAIASRQPMATADGGLNRYDGKSITRFPEVPGLHDNDIYTIFEDSRGFLWIGATGRGAYRYDGQEFKLFDRTTRPDLTQNFGMQAAMEDRDGRLWFGFSGGLFRFDGSQFVNVRRGGPWE